MCGIIGVYNQGSARDELLMGMTSIQHRGQDAAGMVTFENTFHLKKGLGYVSQVFNEKNLRRLTGNIGLGHVRYSTVGAGEDIDVQPFFLSYPFGLAMVHNGNVTNFERLRQTLLQKHHRLLDTSNDVALILYTFAAKLEEKNLPKLTVSDIFDAVSATQKMVEGAYSTLCIVANKGFLAFTDSYGIRPLTLGRKKTSQGYDYAFSSESTAFDFLGYERVRDLGPGEAVFIDQNRTIHSKPGEHHKKHFCTFEYIYFAKEDSILHDKLVSSERVKMGKLLAKQFKEKKLAPDIIIDVPNSAYFFASGLAEALGVPYRRGLSKNNFIGRSFILPSQHEREMAVRQKLNPIREVITGKKIAVVDDSIVRGTTSKYIIKMLRDFGAKEIYFISAAPPVKYRCVYGIDMSVKTQLIASERSEEEIRKFMGADALIYQSPVDLEELYGPSGACLACFTGKYPTNISEQDLNLIEEERIRAAAGGE